MPEGMTRVIGRKHPIYNCLDTARMPAQDAAMHKLKAFCADANKKGTLDGFRTILS